MSDPPTMLRWLGNCYYRTMIVNYQRYLFSIMHWCICINNYYDQNMKQCWRRRSASKGKAVIFSRFQWRQLRNVNVPWIINNNYCQIGEGKRGGDELVYIKRPSERAEFNTQRMNGNKITTTTTTTTTKNIEDDRTMMSHIAKFSKVFNNSDNNNNNNNNFKEKTMEMRDWRWITD